MILERTPEKPSRRVFEPLVLPEGEVGPEDLGRRRAARRTIRIALWAGEEQNLMGRSPRCSPKGDLR